MKHDVRKTLGLGLLGAMAMAAVGCVGSETDDDAFTADPAALQSENGGLSTTPEEPSFGDSVMAGLEGFGAVGTDAVMNESGALPTETAAVPPAGARVFRVMAVWGHLPRPNDASPMPATGAPPQVTDWTGSISVDRGLLSVRRTLGFEQRDTVAPRTDTARVDFVSHTLPHVDGMVLTVRVVGAPGVLHMRTVAFTGDLDLSQVDRDAGVRMLSDGRNGVFYVAYEVRPNCAQGMVFGHWLRTREHLGVFRGRVYREGQGSIGSVRGIWGHRRNGDGVFFGKYINGAGQFQGLLGGSYGDGLFQGHWGTRDPQNRGVITGRYFDGHTQGDGRGAFVGRWREQCR